MENCICGSHALITRGKKQYCAGCYTAGVREGLKTGVALPELAKDLLDEKKKGVDD